MTKRKPNHLKVPIYLFNIYKRNSRYRNLIFNLSKEEFTAIIDKPCYYCGTVGSMSTSRVGGGHQLYIDKPYKHNGVDRKDNNIGYIKGNVVPCCKKCNIFKNRRSISDFKEWVYQVRNHIKNDKSFLYG